MDYRGVGRHASFKGAGLGTLFALVLFTECALAKDGGGGRFCSATATYMFQACKEEVGDDFYTALANCTNISDREERRDCLREARVERREANGLCREQRRARAELCDAVGEDRYEPDFDPDDFEDDFTNLQHPNLYFPLMIGNVWEYEAAGESNTVEVLGKTKLIDGVTCIVVHDRVEKADGAEDTDDWHAQRADGTVFYCGESVRDLEVFPGDNPQDPELVAIDGSFKAGRDGDLPGISFLGAPMDGDSYRQEQSLGNAEDWATVLSTSYGFGNDPELDEHVPQALADMLCSNDCIVTGELTPLEPDLFDRKYYAPGIGLFLEVDTETGEINQLVDCNFDARCIGLPTP